MGRPVRTEWEAGQDIHGRRVRLVQTRSPHGVEEWQILRDAANQRDESAVLYSMSAASLIEMGEIVKANR